MYAIGHKKGEVNAPPVSYSSSEKNNAEKTTAKPNMQNQTFSAETPMKPITIPKNAKTAII